MACYSPISAYQRPSGEVVFAERGDIARSLVLPCGQCVGCRLERSRQWSVRCVHEASLHKASCFVTLTYADDRPSLHYPDFQKFLKRVRKVYGRIRFFVAGEYGDRLGRPHYHALLFGMNFEDRVRFGTSPGGAPLDRSAILERLWPLGFSSVGDVNSKSAAYVARYCMKKVNGQFAARHYEMVDCDGVISRRLPEFCRMSLKPGIGQSWIRKFGSDVSRKGLIVVNGREVKVPRYYEQFFDAELSDDVAQARYEWSLLNPLERTDERLRVREVVAKARVSFKKRALNDPGSGIGV